MKNILIFAALLFTPSILFAQVNEKVISSEEIEWVEITEVNRVCEKNTNWDNLTEEQVSNKLNDLFESVEELQIRSTTLDDYYDLTVDNLEVFTNIYGGSSVFISLEDETLISQFTPKNLTKIELDAVTNNAVVHLRLISDTSEFGVRGVQLISNPNSSGNVKSRTLRGFEIIELVFYGENCGEAATNGLIALSKFD